MNNYTRNNLSILTPNLCRDNTTKRTETIVRVDRSDFKRVRLFSITFTSASRMFFENVPIYFERSVVFIETFQNRVISLRRLAP